MTAPRPVEPVVGMEFYLIDALCVIEHINSRCIRCCYEGWSGPTFTRAWWTVAQENGDLRPVLWTVGPSERRGTRLRDGGIPVTCSADSGGPAKCERCRELLSLYPTRAAALAAGKAHGWERPVARRVRRKVKR